MKIVRGASACLVDERGRVMLIARENEPFRDRLAFPGGKIEEGEAPVDAARRELFEETGYRTSAEPIAQVRVVSDHDGTRYEIDSYAFAEWVSGTHKHATKWLPIDDALESELAPGMRQALLEFRRELARTLAARLA